MEVVDQQEILIYEDRTIFISSLYLKILKGIYNSNSLSRVNRTEYNLETRNFRPRGFQDFCNASSLRQKIFREKTL